MLDGDGLMAKFWSIGGGGNVPGWLCGSRLSQWLVAPYAALKQAAENLTV
jgi:hypothetical protein